MLENKADKTAGQPEPPTPAFMMSYHRGRSNAYESLAAKIASLVPGVVVMLPILDPENPETSRAMAYAVSRRAGFKVRTHKDKDAEGIYGIMRLVDDPKSLSEVSGDNDDNK